MAVCSQVDFEPRFPMRISTVLAMVAALAVAVTGLSYFAGGPPKPLEAPKTPLVKQGEVNPADAGKSKDELDGDYHKTNPFDLDAKAAKNSKASADAVEFKFGVMAPNTEMSHKFIVKNTGTAPLKLAKGHYQCKCTMPTMKKGEYKEVAPGEETDIEMSWKPLAPDEMFRKQVEIWTNDPDHPKLTFSIEGQVIPYIRPEPGSYSLGIVRNEEGRDFEGMLLCGLSADLQILEATSNNELITVKAEPFSDEEIKTIAPGMKKVFRVIGKLLPTEKIGPQKATLTFKTNQPEQEIVTVDVSANLGGPFTMLGSGWDLAHSSFDIGKVEVAKGKSAKFAWFLPQFDGEFELTSVEASPNIAKMSVKKDATFTAVDRVKYDLTVEVVPGAPKGEFSTLRPVVLKVKTNHPRLQEAIFNVHYRGF
jgi:hypothetical protein